MLLKIATMRAMCFAVIAALPMRTAAAEEFDVVVTIAPVHSLAASIMEGVGEPKLLLGGGASAHTYSMKPSDAKALQKARVIVQVSDAYEVFLQKALKTLPKNASVITLDKIAGMDLLPVREGGNFEEHEDEGNSHDHGKKKTGKHDEHDHGGKKAKGADSHEEHGDHDVHIWFDPQNAMMIVDALAAEFSKAAPEHATAFSANAAKTREKLKALDSEITSLLEPVRQKPFIVFHDVVQYFEKRYDVTAVGAVTLSPERQPSAKRLKEVRAKVASLGAACVFAEPQFSPKLVDTIISGTQAKKGTLDEIGVGLKPGPDLYFEFIRANAKNLRNCLGA